MQEQPSTLEQNRLKLISAFERLERTRDIAVGVTVHHPGQGKDALETNWHVDRTRIRYKRLIRRSLKWGPVVDTISALFKKDTDSLVSALIFEMEGIRRKYSRYTSRRAEYGLISPIAFCSLNELPMHLGDPRNLRVFTLFWCPEFQQLSAEGAETGVLELAGISGDGLIRWWSDGSPYHARKETGVWCDLQALALKIVYLLDKTSEDIDVGTTSLFCLIQNVESQNRIRAIVCDLKELGLTIIRMVYLRHQHYNYILPLYELLVPMTYTLAVFLHFSLEDWGAMGEQILSVLERYVSVITDLKMKRATRLGIVNDLERFLESDNRALVVPKVPLVNDKLDTKLISSDERKPALLKEALQCLEPFGLKQMELDLKQGIRIGVGAFSNVFKMKMKDGDYEYAVKFLRADIADDERVKQRLLREVRSWIQLTHKNINTLIGVCIHPDRPLPGLVSVLCPHTLESYLENNLGSISEQEKLCYMKDISEGLSYMHNHPKRLIHGDLRPANILLAPGDFENDFNERSFKAVLCDFGVSDVDEDYEGHIWTTRQHTNEEYLAPELLAKKGLIGSNIKKRISIPGDIYAFGCLFLEVLHDKRMFYYDRKNFVKLKRSGRLPALQEDIRAHYWSIMEQAWHFDPTKRPSASELADDIQSIL